MVEDLNRTNSKTDKAAALAKYPDCAALLTYTYDSFRTYGVTADGCRKQASLATDPGTKDITVLLDRLASRELTGHDAVAAVNGFAKRSGHADLVYDIIDRNLKLRIDEKTINKVFPGCVPTFDVALAQKYADVAGKIDVTGGDWFASRKLDGLRCVAMVDAAGKCKFYSRSGKEFTSLDVVRAEIEKFGIRNVVLDGEMCIVDANGREDFSKAQSEISKKSQTVKNPRYMVFDCIPMVDFLRLESDRKLGQRLADAAKAVPAGNAVVRVLKQDILTAESFARLAAEAEEKKWEGLIFRKDSPYRGKRSNDMLKFKNFHDAEYVVAGIETGPIRHIVNGKDVEDVMMTKAVIEHKGNPVGVGSGWSMEQRQAFHKNPKLIVGKTITVKYFEECKDSKTGKLSLRFPTLKHIYDGKRED